MINPATGWNTWNYEALAALSYVDGDRSIVEIRVSFLDDLSGEHVRDFGWRDVAHLGPHAFDGSYMAIELRTGFESAFLIEAAAQGRRLALSVTPTRTSSRRIVLEMRLPGGPDTAQRAGAVWSLPNGWTVAVEGACPPGHPYARTPGPNAVGGRGCGLTAVVAPPGSDGSPDGAAALVAHARERWAATAVQSGGDLGEGAQAMLRAAAWNTVYDLSGRGMCTTASRDWSRNWKSVVIFGWDTFFHGLIAGAESPETAWANFAAVLGGAAPEGFVPNWRLSHDTYTRDRSQPPVGALCVWRTHLRHPDIDRLAALFPALVRWHDWWMGARGTPEGLLAWGSDPLAAWEFPELRQATHGEHVCCCYESGMDNSPMFDGVPYDTATGRMLQADVGLTSLYAADAECLAHIAHSLGNSREAARLAAEAASIRERIRSLMWDDFAGVFLNRVADGAFGRRMSPTSFYPLLCGAATPEQARRLVDAHLCDPHEFWGEYPLPSISRSDRAFRDNDYWRGRIWAPMVYLVAEGLRRYDMHDVAHEMVWRSHRMLVRGWATDGAVYENYNASTGEGADVTNADPVYVWGGLPAFLAIEELARPIPGGIEFGSPFGVCAEVANLPIRGARYSVRQTSDELEVDRDGAPLLRCAGPARVLAPDSE